MLVEHHVKYKEIHGVDETVWMTPSEHRLLHVRLRKGGGCNISVEDLTKISRAACKRTDKSKKSDKKYEKQYCKCKYFSTTPGPYIQLQERIRYNCAADTITYCALFRGTHSHILPVIDII